MSSTKENVSDEVSKGQQARNALRQSLRSQRLVLNAPTLHADNPLLPDTADDDSNKLAKQYQGTILKVEVPQFVLEVDPGRAGLVWLNWDNVRQHPSQFAFTTPINPAVFPLQLTLPVDATLGAGRHSLTFTANVQGNGTISEPLPIYIDQLAPNSGQAGAVVTLPEEVESDGITKEYLDANGFVLVTVPAYRESKIGDVVELYFGRSNEGAARVGTQTRADTSTPVTFELTPGLIGDQEGPKFLFYKLTDRVGNVGPDSNYKPIRVVLTPAPANLKPLTVPLALPSPGDDLIDIEDARTGVQAQIEAYTNSLPGDRIVVTWDGQEVSGDVAATGPTFVTIPYTVLLNGDPGEKTVDVTYRIERGDLNYPEPTTVQVNVDLRLPGPTDPENPGPVNDALELVTVLGAVSATPNKLTTEDAGEDATASVLIYDYYKPGDVVQLYWAGTAVPDSGDPAVPGGIYVVTGSEDAEFQIEFSIPWAVIEAAGNSDAIPVHYSIAHPSVNDAVVLSGNQPVEVAVMTVTLPAITFLHLDPDFGLLNCGSLRRHATLEWVAELSVDGGEPKLAGQLLTFDFVGTAGAGGQDATFKFTFTPTPEQANNGFVVYLPYDPPLITLRDGTGSISYTASIDGIPASSANTDVDVWMGRAGAGAPTCELTLGSARP
ncbi:hypothetical protein [Pseudomonas bohemica]|uniref:hypothetical protein n=1 Tax=Pseudomonas bohemica TaxID=2044872 RepID=UPI000DA5EDFE|nr:hypothetical protein [Pseudomonas bohemica]